MGQPGTAGRNAPIGATSPPAVPVRRAGPGAGAQAPRFGPPPDRQERGAALSWPGGLVGGGPQPARAGRCRQAPADRARQRSGAADWQRPAADSGARWALDAVVPRVAIPPSREWRQRLSSADGCRAVVRHQPLPASDSPRRRSRRWVQARFADGRLGAASGGRPQEPEALRPRTSARRRWRRRAAARGARRA